MRERGSLDVKGFPVMRKWYIVHHKNRRLPPIAVAFKEFLLQEGAGCLPVLGVAGFSGRQ
jgi:hypothetical protein